MTYRPYPTYRPYAIDCKTVTVTEACPEPTLTLTVDSTDGLTVTVTVASSPGSGESWIANNPWIGWGDGTHPTSSASDGTYTYTYANPGTYTITFGGTNSCHNYNEDKKDVTVSEDYADIVATSIVTTPSTCEAPCDISISITWTNNGTVAGTFTPGFTINGTLYTYDDITLDAGASITENYTYSASSAGTYVVCPSPNP